MIYRRNVLDNKWIIISRFACRGWPSSEVIYLLGMRDCDTIPQMSFTLHQNQYFKICLSIVTGGRIQHIKSYATIVEVHMIVLHETSGVYGNSIPVVYLY